MTSLTFIAKFILMNIAVTTLTGIIFQTTEPEKISITRKFIILYTLMTFHADDLLMKSAEWKICPGMIKSRGRRPAGQRMTFQAVFL